MLGRLKWLEKGREGLLEELSEELDGLEGGTIQQVYSATMTNQLVSFDRLEVDPPQPVHF